MKWKADQRVCALPYQIKNDTGTAPGWRTEGRGEKEQSNICLNIWLTPSGEFMQDLKLVLCELISLKSAMIYLSHSKKNLALGF